MKFFPLDPYQDLRLASRQALPKKCPKCGREFHGLDEFLRNTRPLAHSSGLMHHRNHQKGSFVLLFRDCICHNTIAMICEDRRDQSAAGRKRRAVFGDAMKEVGQAGIDQDQARLELFCLRQGRSGNKLRALRLDPERLRAILAATG